MLFNAVERTVTVPGGQVTCVLFGRGDKNLVIIPGLSLRSINGTALPLAWMYRIFCKEYRVCVIDRKDNIPEDCTVAGLADDTAEAMRQIGIEMADVIGISQGGMIAQYLTLSYPEMVRKLVLGVTLSRPNEVVDEAVRLWIQSAGCGDYHAIVQDMMQRMYSEQYRRRFGWLFPVLLRTVKLSDPERFIRLAKACLTCNTYDRLSEIFCPLLVLGGQEDLIVTGKASEEIAEKTGCRIYMYEGLGHSAYEEARDFNRRIYAFLQEPI